MYVGGTTLLTGAYSPSEKAKTQGMHDFLVFGVTIISSFDDRQPRVPIRRGFDLNQIIGTDQGLNYPICGQSTRSCLVITARLGNQ